MGSYVLFFSEVDASKIEEVGGKGANLGVLGEADFPVPPGFCVTTSAYRAVIKSSIEMDKLLTQCEKINVNNLEELKETGEKIRDHIKSLHIPRFVIQEILEAWQSVGENYSYAVRSSATAEDLPSASFAGQQDTFLNVQGEKELLEAIRNCWASLFTDRAIAYRVKNDFDHRHVFLSVVVQRMVQPEISGIMFTAEPVNGNRLVTSIDASFGLGEALVSGLVTADLYKVKHDKVISKKIASKKIMIESLADGGTKKSTVPKEKQDVQVLTNEQILALSKLGKQIEKHFGFPQDIEFCIENGKIFVVQSRPITSLYPMPQIEADPLRVMLSFGHIQMMTEPMKPLGISVFRTLFPFGKPDGSFETNFLIPAGGRLFVDPSDILRFRLARKVIPKILSNMDSTMSLALQEVIHRPAFTTVPPKPGLAKIVRYNLKPVLKEVFQNIFRRDPNLAKSHVETYMFEQHKKMKGSLHGLDEVESLEKIQGYLATSLLSIFQNLFPFIAPFLLSAGVLKKYLIQWIGNDQTLQKLSQSFAGNVTSEMGLAIGDLADVLRELPEVEEYLRTAKDEDFFEQMDLVEGGEKFHPYFAEFLDKYGRRCPGEIDITNTRWREKPTLLIPAILGHMRSVKHQEHRNKFRIGEQEAKDAEAQIMSHLKGNPLKARLMKRLISLYRNLGALREHHKYFLITILDESKKVIMRQADHLVEQKILEDREDVYYLSLGELLDLSRNGRLEDLEQKLEERKKEYIDQQKLQPPRVRTSEGEVVTPTLQKGDFPQHALMGTPVSAGVVEGRARIVLRPEEAQLHEGEILVAPFTDPGWTPLFQSAIGLVTEVGGLMTHGSVVAREYGIPAVVGVEDACKRIKNGQKIRVDGTQGYVEILSEKKE
ncbi:phosphoenolpyruvate synthase [Shimazuella kribbensis]|uniref:phosphoenolpyruvate synthase n=1 Tax=Shimazuella kribbensis TaxID=139808 RepID=UPI000414B2B8|nr:phosphoenolpyruvate synthase [Shimazuella kribbensis]